MRWQESGLAKLPRRRGACSGNSAARLGGSSTNADGLLCRFYSISTGRVTANSVPSVFTDTHTSGRAVNNESAGVYDPSSQVFGR